MPESNLLIFQRTPVQVHVGTGQGYHRIYIGGRTIPGPSGSSFYFVPKDPNDNSKGGIARIPQHQNMLPPPRTFMTSPDDRITCIQYLCAGYCNQAPPSPGRLSRQGRQLWMYDYGMARLKEQKMDWLSQTGTIMDVWPLGHIVTAAPMKSDWEMRRNLAILAINASGTPFQSGRESFSIRWPNRACGTSGWD
ncbi:hypothetical protein LTR06_009388 [Exophiala xenobiotica]|nr:hypothetical protein LTR06_009388 [Exophiala xenobiotica]